MVMIIILAKTDTIQVPVNPDRVRTDLGERHTFRDVRDPKALTWCLEGDDVELAKAQLFAEREDWTVFTFDPYVLRDKCPLTEARRLILEKDKPVEIPVVPRVDCKKCRGTGQRGRSKFKSMCVACDGTGSA
jgi:hypothetical protein